MVKEVYTCECCEKTIPISKVKSHKPTCCGKPMKKVPLNICLQPDQAEHARPMRDEEPCDDSRAG